MDITKQLTAIAQEMGCRYTIKGEPVTYDHVFSPSGLLPGFMRRADQLCSFCLGYGLGLTFDRSDNATMGVVVQMDTNTPTVLRLLCVTDVLNEMMQQAANPAAISLDDLLQE